MTSHLEKVKENQKFKYSINPLFNIHQKVQSRINNFFNSQEYKAVDLLGCDIYFLYEWLKFIKNDNDDIFDLEIDHIIPLSEIRDKKDLNQIYRIFNWSNLTLSSEHDNKSRKSKRNQHLEEKQAKYLKVFLSIMYDRI